MFRAALSNENVQQISWRFFLLPLLPHEGVVAQLKAHQKKGAQHNKRSKAVKLIEWMKASLQCEREQKRDPLNGAWV